MKKIFILSMVLLYSNCEIFNANDLFYEDMAEEQRLIEEFLVVTKDTTKQNNLKEHVDNLYQNIEKLNVAIHVIANLHRKNYYDSFNNNTNQQDTITNKLNSISHLLATSSESVQALLLIATEYQKFSFFSIKNKEKLFLLSELMEKENNDFFRLKNIQKLNYIRNMFDHILLDCLPLVTENLNKLIETDRLIYTKKGIELSKKLKTLAGEKFSHDNSSNKYLELYLKQTADKNSIAPGYIEEILSPITTHTKLLFSRTTELKNACLDFIQALHL